ncbi:helix-turn-helix domain-containing protein [Sphingobacterium oryzagri]|uniref:Helix-turn-helix domain-containing protein n=1 Tax=Sphingobacterium oryzagri TaxID=3025669 RepID=A0ABY7WKW9_9SPHI|nr:helix-turn-helix domain-containing protein [Sphingobacterium sp. KACC 22765]WDF70160.1 helix-turn-helix domain-containing protein [Sphingobacterium sp. KACC 22765]
MPIQCLTSIRFSFDLEQLSLPVESALDTFVVGIYEFDLASLGNEVALFNDGFPALVILPRQELKSTCRVHDNLCALDSRWFAAGAVSQSYWLPPHALANEKLTIVRFFPSAWQALFGKPAVLQPYVHNLTDYHSGLATVFERIYDAPSVVQGLTSLLVSLFAQRPIDARALAFDQLAMAVEQNSKAHSQSVSSLSNFHPKWIQRQFKRSMGVSPYQFVQLQRFIAAYRCFQEDAAPNLHSIADACGYYDANHLVKDFNKYLGVSPRQYFKARSHQ